MRKLFFVLLLIATWSSSIAQDSIQWPVFKGKKTFERYIYDLVQIDSYFRINMCAKFVTSMKFAVDRNGFISSVFISESTPTYFSSRLKDAIYSTHGTWEPMKRNGKEIDSSPMILVLEVNLKGGCKYEYGSAMIEHDDFEETLNTVFKYSAGEKTSDMLLDNSLMLAPEIWQIPEGCQDLIPVFPKRRGNR